MSQPLRIQACGPGDGQDAAAGGGCNSGDPNCEPFAGLLYAQGTSYKEQAYDDGELPSSLMPSPVSSPQMMSYSGFFIDFDDANRNRIDDDADDHGHDALFLNGIISTGTQLDTRMREIVQGKTNSGQGNSRKASNVPGGDLCSLDGNAFSLQGGDRNARGGKGHGMGSTDSNTESRASLFLGQPDEHESVFFGPRPKPGSRADLIERLGLMRDGTPEVLNCNDNDSIVKKMVFYEEQERVKKLIRRALTMSKGRSESSGKIEASASLFGNFVHQRARRAACSRIKAMDEIILHLVEAGNFGPIRETFARAQHVMKREEEAEDAEHAAKRDAGHRKTDPRLTDALLEAMERVCTRMSTMLDRHLDSADVSRPLMPLELEMRNYAIACRFRTSLLQLKLLECPEPEAVGVVPTLVTPPNHARLPTASDTRRTVASKKCGRSGVQKRNVSYGGLGQSACVVLTRWFHANFEHPYPEDEDKEKLARESGLSVKQVSNWFINQRVRKWKPELQKIKAETRARSLAANR